MKLLRSAAALSATLLTALSCSSPAYASGQHPAPQPTTSASAPRIWPTRGAPAPTVPRIAWHTCDEADQRRLHLQCATVPVPLDYAKPKGPRIALDVVRHRASGKRIGSLFVNPGGPGGSAIDHMGEFLDVLGKPVSSRFDFIGVDPRGVGVDSQAHCWSTRPEPAQGSDYPRSQAEIRARIGHDAYERTACAASGRPIIDHMSTGNAARDMDLIRQAVGDRQLTYYGVSYGTVLASTYAALFPTKVRAIIEDGVVDPVQWTTGAGNSAKTVPVSARAGSGAGADETLRAAFAACRQAGPKRCPNGTNLAKEWDTLLVTLDRRPVTSGGDTLTRSSVVSSALTSLYAPDTLPALMAWIHQSYLAATKRPHQAVGGVHKATPAAPTLGPVITPTRPQPNNSQWFDTFKQAGVMCADSVNPTDPRAWARHAAQSEKTSWFTPVWTWNSSICAGWPGHDSGVYRGPFNRTTAHPVLIVGTTHDPATPLSAARSTQRLLSGSRLITVDAFGHTASNKSAGALQAMQQYLIKGTLPRNGASYRADHSPF